MITTWYRVLWAALAVIAGASLATMAAIADERSAPPPPSSESLSLPMGMTGTSWQMITNDKKSGYAVEEFVPRGESGGSWNEMVTVQAFDRPDLDTSRFIAMVIGQVTKGCGEAQLLEKGTPVEGGLQTFNALALCQDPPPHPELPNATLKKYEVIWFKGIQGRLRAYVVQRAWHSDSKSATSILASDATRQSWRNWIYAVCIATDSGDGKGPHCPARS